MNSRENTFPMGWSSNYNRRTKLNESNIKRSYIVYAERAVGQKLDEVISSKTCPPNT